MMPEFMEIVAVFFFVVTVLGFVWAIRMKRQKKALVDRQFKNARFFSLSSIAVSEDGLIGIGVFDKILTKPAIIHIRDIQGFGLILNQQSLTSVKKIRVDEFIFEGLDMLIDACLEKEISGQPDTGRLKSAHKISMVFMLKNTRQLMEIPLKTSFFSTALRTTQQLHLASHEIKQLLSTLAHIEKIYQESGQEQLLTVIG